MFTKKGKKKQTKKDTSGNVTHYEMQSCLSKEYSSSHQTLKMFTLPKLILIPNSWSINTTLSSFVCVYFSSYFAPAWNKHYVSVSDQVFQRCDLQPRTFFFFVSVLSASTFSSINGNPKASSQEHLHKCAPLGQHNSYLSDSHLSIKTYWVTKKLPEDGFQKLDVLPDTASE